MGIGLRIQVINRETSAREFEKVFHDFPVRIGRDALNEIELHGGFVSKFHASLDLAGDTVIVRDLGSRNGTYVGSPAKPIDPDERVDLREHGFVFNIGPLHISTEIVEASRIAEERERGGAMLSGQAGRAPMTARIPAAESHATTAEARLLAGELRAPYESYRSAWAKFYERLSECLQPMQHEARTQVMHLLATDFPAMFVEPDFQRLAKHVGVEFADIRPTGIGEQEAALHVIQELAAWYKVAPLKGPDDVVRFAQRMQDALDALFEAYVRLRDGLNTFETEFDVRRHTHPSSAVEAARTKEEVGAHMLDWTDPTGQPAHAVKRLAADVLIHDLGMLNGVMKGVTALLAQLSPTAVTESFENARRAGRTGIAFGPFRFRELWRQFELRHGDYASEETHTFATLFGREFAQAYKHLQASVIHEGQPALARPRVGARPSGPPVVAKTLETRGFAPKGPTGTVVVPREPAPRPREGSS